MKATLFVPIALLAFQQLLASDFKPNPTWVINQEGKSGYTVYENYQEVTAAEAEADATGIVRFANRIWRGTTDQFLERRIKAQSVLGKACDSSVLLANGGKYIELGRATVNDPSTPFRQVFLMYEWDDQGGGTRKSTFFINDETGVLKIGEAIEIGGGLALVKIGADQNEWVRLLIVDLNTFRPKGTVSFSDMEFTGFTFGQNLTIRYKEPVTRAQILTDNTAVDNLPWIDLPILTNGVLNPDVIDETQFDISIPPAQ